MNNRRFTKLISSAAFATALLFNQTASANTQSAAQPSKPQLNDELQIVEEIKLGFAAILQELGFPAVQSQVQKSLEKSTTEFQAGELVKAATGELPDYKLKVVITTL